MVGVMTIPTGLGCTIGGHAGDATPAARLIAAACDKLIVHPNVVNASDICELTDNMLYVEGSTLDRFLSGTIELQEVRSNRILIVANRPGTPVTVNAMNAARVTLGIDAKVLELDAPLIMRGKFYHDGTAGGDVIGHRELLKQIETIDFDALAIHTSIDVPRDVALKYFRRGGVNPWGGVEAIASRLISTALDKPVAHAPLESTTPDDDELWSIGANEIVDPRMAPEILSTAYLHCVLKGLHRAPRIGPGLSVDDVDVAVFPAGCRGRAHEACFSRGIPVIVVRENTCCLERDDPEPTLFAENYLEAAGMIMAMRAGVTFSSVAAKPSPIANCQLPIATPPGRRP